MNNLALSEFYCGRVLQSQSKHDEALKAYLEAETVADKIRDMYIGGIADFFIAELNDERYLFSEAITYFKKAASKFALLEDNQEQMIATYTEMATAFTCEQESMDSAFVYYNKALAIAEENDNRKRLFIIYQNMGVAFWHIGEIERAKDANLRALSFAPQEDKMGGLYSVMAKICWQENKVDSALYYANESLNVYGSDSTRMTSVFGLISEIEKSVGNYKRSLEYCELYTEQVLDLLGEQKDLNLLDVQKKYNFELIQNANRKLTIERLWLLIAFILLAVSSFLIYFIKRAKNKEALLLSKQHIYQLKEMVAEKDKVITENQNKEDKNIVKNRELKATLFKQLDILKKISLLELYLAKDEKQTGQAFLKKMHSIVYDSNEKFDWTIFYQSVNALYDNFLDRLSTLYPSLTADEILVCCLSKIELNNEEIALLMKSTVNIIQKKRTSIREKTGMKKQESFVKQLDEVAYPA